MGSSGFQEGNLGCPGNFVGKSRAPGGVQKVCAKKGSCAFFGFQMVFFRFLTAACDRGNPLHMDDQCLETPLFSAVCPADADDALNSEKLEKAGAVDFKKHPARKVGTRSRQCGPKVPGRFAFPGARNPSAYSIWRVGKVFPAFFPEFSWNFPPELPQRPQKQPPPSRVF